MPRACVDNTNTVEHLAQLLDAVKQIGVDDLERIVQLAHECDVHQIDDPRELFPITRQALRMFWHFRCNLEAVKIRRV